MEMGGGSPAWRETRGFLLFPPHLPTVTVSGSAKEGDQESQLGVAGEGGRLLKQPIWFPWDLTKSCVWGPDEQTLFRFPGQACRRVLGWGCFGFSGQHGEEAGEFM